MTKPISILELRSVRGTGGGPEKTILMGAARTDPRRFAVTVCYLRDARDAAFRIDAKASELPIDYVELVERHSFDPSILSGLRRLVRERAIDIVHAHDYKTNLVAYLLSKLENIIPLSTVHGWTGHTAREQWLYYPLDKRFLARFPRLIAVSSDIRSVLVATGTRPDRVSVILNGIDHRLFSRDELLRTTVRREMGFAPTEFVIGATGRLEPQKRFDILIEAIALLLPRYSMLRLVIAGDGSLRRQLESQARATLPTDSCRFLGDTSAIIRLHHALDLLVQSSDYEGTPNAVLEAMALGTPIVATDVGGTSELLTDGVHGLIVPSGNPASLSAAIERTLEDRDAARSRAASARARVERDLSFETRMQAVERIYEEMMSASGSSRSKGALRWV